MAKTSSKTKNNKSQNPFFVKPLFSENHGFLGWLEALHNPEENYISDAKGWKPELRRAYSLGAVLNCKAFIALCDAVSDTIKKKFKGQPNDPTPEYVYMRLALIAGVVVHGKYHKDNKDFVGKTLKGKDKSRAALSEQRFRRLMSLDDENELDEIFLEWKRVTTMFKDSISLPQLADTLFYWADRYNGDKVRANLAFFYYGGSDADEQTADEESSEQDNGGNEDSNDSNDEEAND